jgi:hypothetical protein
MLLLIEKSIDIAFHHGMHQLWNSKEKIVPFYFCE